MFNGRLFVEPLRRAPGMNWWTSITCNGIKVADITGATDVECKQRADLFVSSSYLKQENERLKNTVFDAKQKEGESRIKCRTSALHIQELERKLAEQQAVLQMIADGDTLWMSDVPTKERLPGAVECFMEFAKRTLNGDTSAIDAIRKEDKVNLSLFEEETERSNFYMDYRIKVDKETKELESERQSNALLGQAALDEANNRIQELERELLSVNLAYQTQTDTLIKEKAELERKLAEQQPNNYIQTVPDHCDRIIWRDNYYHLPIKGTEDLSRLVSESEQRGREASRVDMFTVEELHEHERDAFAAGREAEREELRKQEPVAWNYRKYFPLADKVTDHLTFSVVEAMLYDREAIPLYAKPMPPDDYKQGE